MWLVQNVPDEVMSNRPFPLLWVDILVPGTRNKKGVRVLFVDALNDSKKLYYEFSKNNGHTSMGTYKNCQNTFLFNNFSRIPLCKSRYSNVCGGLYSVHW